MLQKTLLFCFLIEGAGRTQLQTSFENLSSQNVDSAFRQQIIMDLRDAISGSSDSIEQDLVNRYPSILNLMAQIVNETQPPMTLNESNLCLQIKLLLLKLVDRCESTDDDKKSPCYWSKWGKRMLSGNLTKICLMGKGNETTLPPRTGWIPKWKRTFRRKRIPTEYFLIAVKVIARAVLINHRR
eukprot:Seg626.3 transcript_id=Seg626.3/GoldUCD/mRNA.D3Y31 product="hypothetical protein" protein_id=Seg626.3/GoldUCD/D3Y31